MADLSTPTNDGQSEQTSDNLITQHIDIWTTAIEQKSSAGRGSSKKFSLYGIKKLRELILELAVRGKLVPQDENDEPASVLLERVAAEKAQLVKEGKLKKQKPLPEISEDEKPFELPNGWEFERFGNVYSLEYGDNLPKPKRSGTGEVDVYGSNGVVGTHNQKSVDLPCIVVGRKGSAGALNLCNSEGCWVTDVAYSTVPPVGISLRFAFLQFHTLELDTLGKGIKPGLNRNEAYVVVLALPPLEEQHRIVAKVDELMSLCDALEAQTEASIAAHQTLVETLLNALLLPNTTQPAHSHSASHEYALNDSFAESWQRVAEHFDTLFTTEASIDTLKQTILQLAVMGKLVPQDPNDEPAAKLLERIKVEKAQLIKDGKIKKQKPLPAITDEEKPFELPKGWEWTCLAELAEIGPRNSSFDDDTEASFVPMTLISNSYKGNHGSETRLWKEIKKGYTHFADGDIGLAKITPCFENSKAAVFSGLVNGVGAGTTELHIARPIESTVDSLFILLYLKAPMFLKVGETKMTGTAGQKRVPKDFFAYNPLPFAPLEEQHRIVAKVDELMSLCDQLKGRLTDAQTTQLQLTDAIVEQAV